MRRLLLLLIIIAVSSSLAFASDFLSGATITITKPQKSDLYISGGTVIINAPVYGDIIITGGKVEINDSIMADVLIAGGKVTLNGYVGDDVRCAGGRITIRSFINGDLVVAGGIVTVTPSSSSASVTVTGGNVDFGGTSRSWLFAAASRFTLSGTVMDNAECKGSILVFSGKIKGKASLAASEDIRFERTARIDRAIHYWLPFQRELELPAGVSTARPVYDPLLSITHEHWYFLGASTFLGLLWYLGMAFLLILIIQYLFSTTLFRAGIKIRARPIRSFFLGIGYFVCLPIASLLLLVTIVGLPLFILTAMFYVMTVLLATVISSIVIVNWVSYLSDRDFGLMKSTGMALFTFALLKILTFTPFFGQLLVFMIYATSFGAIISSIRWKPVVRENNQPVLELQQQ